MPMDDIPIAEMKKLEVPRMVLKMGRCDIKMNQRQQQQQQQPRELFLPADSPIDVGMVTKMNPNDGDPFEKLDTAENGGDLGESGIPDSPSVMERMADLPELMMDRCDIVMEIRKQQQHSEPSIPADFPNDAEMVKKMNPELYKAIKDGKIEYIQESTGDVERSILLETSPKLNTILHVATSSGHDQLVQKILDIEWCRKLVTATNSTGDLALHVAANAGHLSIVKLLVSTEQLEWEDSTVGQLREENKDGNTPLHLALINKYQKVAFKTKYRYHELASFLVEKDPVVSYFGINKEMKSPLYLAAEAGDAELVNLMIKKGNFEMEMPPCWVCFP